MISACVDGLLEKAFRVKSFGRIAFHSIMEEFSSCTEFIHLITIPSIAGQSFLENRSQTVICPRSG